jgi:hypothetical protein
VRRIIEADLWEISVVTFPMLPDARIDTVKGRGDSSRGRLPTVREFEGWLTRDAGLTRGEARRGDRKRLCRSRATAGRRAAGPPGGKDPRGDTHDDVRNRNMGNHIMTEHNLARAPETKIEVKSAGDHVELAGAFDEFMTTFEAFKDGNDRRLAELEARGADVLTVEKVDRISKALDEQKRAIDGLTLKRIRPALERGGSRAMPSEHKQAFDAYMRSGDDRLIRALDTKAMSYGSGQDGGYLVPGRDRSGDRQPPCKAVADPLDRNGAAGVGSRAEEAVLGDRAGGRLGGGDGVAAADHYRDAGRAVVPDDGTLRHAGGHRVAAGGHGGRPRPVDLRRGGSSLRRAGGHRPS